MDRLIAYRFAAYVFVREVSIWLLQIRCERVGVEIPGAINTLCMSDMLYTTVYVV